MAAILNLRKILNMSLCCLSMSNMHSENEKDPAHRFRTMHVFSILTTNYRSLSPLMAAILDFFEISNMGCVESL